MSKRDPAWEHGTEVEAGNKKLQVRCNYCSKVVGSITRLKLHLVGRSTDVKKCQSVPEAVKTAVQIQEEGRRARKSQMTAAQLSESSHGGQQENRINGSGGAMEEDANLASQVTPADPSIAAAADHRDIPAEHTDIDNALVAVVPPVSLAEPADDSNIVIAFKGLTGACTEDAVFDVYPNCIPLAYHKFEEALQAVESLQADKAIIPLENSFWGSFIENYDLVYSHNLHIVAEVQMSINPCLLALEGVTLDALTRVLGSPQELAQVDSFLTNLGVEKETLNEDSRESQFISSNTRQPVGIIASAKAADFYALGILAKGIQGDNKSFTRFWILGRDPVVQRMTDEFFKTSIAFTLKDGTQSLAWALLAFSQRDIKVTKVEIRPQRQPLQILAGSSTGTGTAADQCFDYVFFVDFENSTADDRVCNALRHLKELVTSVRILGSYPVMEVNSSE